MANRPTAQTFNNDVSLLWLLKDAKTVYRSVLAQAEADSSDSGLATMANSLGYWNALKAEIIDTADQIESQIVALSNTLSEKYVYSKTEEGSRVIEDLLGEYVTTSTYEAQYNQIATTIVDPAIGSYREEIQGQIIRGFVPNPDYDSGQPVGPNNPDYLYGIVIATQTNIVANSTKEYENNNYYEVNTQVKPTFGFYTSQGWSFWIKGNRVGWYDSNDGRLHTNKQEVVDNIKLGNWMISHSGGFGIKYLGELGG